MTTTDMTNISKPEIVISTEDHVRLLRLAEGLAQRLPEVAGELLTEVERARVVSADDLTGETVAMGSAVTYETETGERREVTLVYPDEADIAKGRISILTPIGVALIGLSAGQSMNWVTRDGRRRTLTVTRVGAA